MKQIILSGFLVVALLSLAACSNNDDKADGREVNIVQTIDFKVNFADYNSEQEANVTRAINTDIKLEQKTVNLGNGILAQCTLLRDTTKQDNHIETRAIPNDTYTMLAYDATTHALKGEITGTVTSSVFSPNPSQKLRLQPGNYDFVLFNSKVVRSGNHLTVNRANASAALIGRTTKTIIASPNDQQVEFTLKHIGAKVKLKLTGYMNFSGVTATLSSVNSTDIPGSSVYDASTGTWNVGSGAAMSDNITYGANPESPFVHETYTSTSNEVPFIAPTDVSKLKLKFKSGNIYRLNMTNAGLTFNPTSPLILQENGAYVLNVKLMYNFLYLMSDGTTGFYQETTFGGGTKTPIAVVVSQNKHLAVALKYANGGNPCSWASWVTGGRHNKIAIPVTNAVALLAMENGYQETWDAAASFDNTTVKGTSTEYPAFKAAGDYTPGVPVSGNMIGKKWYLPAFGEWKYVFTELAFGDITQVQNVGDFYRYNAYLYLLNLAFTQVGGDNIFNGGLWSSTAEGTYNTYMFSIFLDPYGSFVSWCVWGKDKGSRVRPFIRYQ